MSGGPVLRDIHLPPEPGWWPPAPGWWVLIAVAIAVLAWLAWQWHRRARRVRAKRILWREFDRIRKEYPSATEGARQVAALSELLRRAARKHAPDALNLRDEAWLGFLDAEDGHQPFSRGAGRLLLDGPYRPAVAPDEAEALAMLVRARLDRFVTVSHA